VSSPGNRAVEAFIEAFKPQPRLRILLDCDGVLAHFTRTFLEYFGSTARDEDINRFDIAKALGMPADSYARFGADVGWLNLCSVIPPYPGARAFVAALQARHDVYACTSPLNAAWLSQRAAWLERHVGIPLKQQIHCADKSLVAGGVLIDDAIHNCAAFPGRSILFAQPWNAEGAPDSPGVKRLDGYAAVLAELGC
jgi:5'(3')-deoxyribonucleotidase